MDVLSATGRQGGENEVMRRREARRQGLPDSRECGQAVLAEMVCRLVAELQPERIYLFGSRARGETAPDSDYDLLVVVPASDLAPHRRDLLAFRALCGVGAAKDVVVYTREEFEARSRAASSLVAGVLREGRLVYAA
jgi:predicted nucleotidyltransferase